MKVRFAVAPHPGTLSRPAVAAFAEALEAARFDGMWLSDLPVAPALDPLLGIALAAGRTTRLRLGANVVPLGRNPFLLAKELAQLDQLSDGRLLLSFVTGLGQPGEREVLGLSGSDRRRDEAGRILEGVSRGAILEEMLGLIRRWWAGETVAHRSERWTYTSVPPASRPVQEPLEVWLGGRGPKALERVGRIADGWLGSQLTPAEAGPARHRISLSAQRSGREFDPEHFGMSIAYAHTDPGRDVLGSIAARRPDLDPRSLLPIGRERLRACVRAYCDAGLSKFVLRPATPVPSWDEEAAWLSDAVLDLQT